MCRFIYIIKAPTNVSIKKHDKILLLVICGVKPFLFHFMLVNINILPLAIHIKNVNPMRSNPYIFFKKIILIVPFTSLPS